MGEDEQAIAQTGLSQVPFTPGAPTSPEEFATRKEQYKTVLSDPRIQQAMLYTGLHMLANKDTMSSAGAGLGQGALFAMGALSKNAAARNQQEQQERQQRLAEEKEKALQEDRDADRAETRAGREQRASEAAEDRRFRAGESAADRALRERQLKQSAADAAAGRGLQRQRIELEQQQLNETLAQKARERRIKLMELARKASETRDTLGNVTGTDAGQMVATAAELERMMENPRGLNEQVQEATTQRKTVELGLSIVRNRGLDGLKEVAPYLMDDDQLAAASKFSDQQWRELYETLAKKHGFPALTVE